MYRWTVSRPMPLCTRPRPRANEAHPPSQRRAGGLEQLEGWSSWSAWAERAELMKGLAHVLTVPPVTTHTLSCNLPSILWVRRFRNEGRSKLRQRAQYSRAGFTVQFARQDTGLSRTRGRPWSTCTWSRPPRMNRRRHVARAGPAASAGRGCSTAAGRHMARAQQSVAPALRCSRMAPAGTEAA